MTSNWKECKLGDLCDSISDSYKRNDEKVVLINTSDVLEGKILNHELVDNKNLKGQFKKTFQKYDILYSEIRPANKRFAFVDIEDTYNYIASTKLMVIRPDLKKVLPKYLYMILKSQPIIDELQHLAETRSGTFPQITFSSELSQMEILLPSLEIQQKIAKVLSAIDDKIELNNSINNNLEQQIQSIFKRNFIDSEYIFVKDTTIGDICKCELGGTPSRTKPEYWNGNVAWINSGEVNKFRITKPSEYITDLGLSKSATKLLPKKTTVLAITGATLGQISLLEIDSCANQSVVGIIENDTLPYEFIYPYVVNNIKELISHQTGGAQQHINKQNIESLKLLLPDNEIINNYKKLVKPLFETISNNCFENESLIQLRDILLPKLMSGEIDVDKVEV